MKVICNQRIECDSNPNCRHSAPHKPYSWGGCLEGYCRAVDMHVECAEYISEEKK